MCKEKLQIGCLYNAHFNARITKQGGMDVQASLEVLFFNEDKNVIAYCPALDLSVAGDTVKQAKEEFAQAFYEYATYCVQNDTMEADLIAHGWICKDGQISAPSITKMLPKNPALRDIIDNKEYRKLTIRVGNRRKRSTQPAFA